MCRHCTLDGMKSLLLSVLCILMMASCTRDETTGSDLCNTANAYYIFSQGGGKIIMPNAFTPNGDGLNDLLRPIGVTGMANFSLTVFGLNGSTIYTSSDPFSTGWDGRYYSGVPAPAGLYTVYIHFRTVNGDDVERNICVALLEYGAANCIQRSFGGNYYFEDQIDPSTGNVVYSTMENYCQ